jgi:hypothetical protein
MKKLNLVQSDTNYSEGERMKIIPYTTASGLQIGCRYEPKMSSAISQDMELLQLSYLHQDGQSSLLDRMKRFWRGYFNYE